MNEYEHEFDEDDEDDYEDLYNEDHDLFHGVHEVFNVSGGGDEIELPLSKAMAVVEVLLDTAWKKLVDVADMPFDYDHPENRDIIERMKEDSRYKNLKLLHHYNAFASVMDRLVMFVDMIDEEGMDNEW